jgi:hypothetical protein
MDEVGRRDTTFINSYITGGRGRNKKGEFEVEAQFLGKLNTNNG